MPRQYQPNNCPFDPSEFTVAASEVARRLSKSLSTLDRWGRLPNDHRDHLYGLKKGREWYYRQPDIVEHEIRSAGLERLAVR